MAKDDNNCPACNDNPHPTGEALKGNENAQVRAYTPPTAAELEFTRNFYAAMNARDGEGPVSTLPIQQPTLTRDAAFQHGHLTDGMKLPDTSGLVSASMLDVMEEGAQESGIVPEHIMPSARPPMHFDHEYTHIGESLIASDPVWDSAHPSVDADKPMSSLLGPPYIDVSREQAPPPEAPPAPPPERPTCIESVRAPVCAILPCERPRNDEAPPHYYETLCSISIKTSRADQTLAVEVKAFRAVDAENGAPEEGGGESEWETEPTADLLFGPVRGTNPYRTFVECNGEERKIRIKPVKQGRYLIHVIIDGRTWEFDFIVLWIDYRRGTYIRLHRNPGNTFGAQFLDADRNHAIGPDAVMVDFFYDSPSRDDAPIRVEGAAQVEPPYFPCCHRIEVCLGQVVDRFTIKLRWRAHAVLAPQGRRIQFPREIELSWDHQGLIDLRNGGECLSRAERPINCLGRTVEFTDFPKPPTVPLRILKELGPGQRVMYYLSGVDVSGSFRPILFARIPETECNERMRFGVKSTLWGYNLSFGLEWTQSNVGPVFEVRNRDWDSFGLLPENWSRCYESPERH